jgi:hypothetical protein
MVAPHYTNEMWPIDTEQPDLSAHKFHDTFEPSFQPVKQDDYDASWQIQKDLLISLAKLSNLQQRER